MTAYNFALIQPLDNQPPKYQPGFVYTAVFEYNLGGTALVNADTITTPTGSFPANLGINILDVVVSHGELDTNATPTGTYAVGDANDSTRYIAAAPLGVNGVTTAGFVLNNRIAAAQTIANGVVTKGAGYLVNAADYQMVLTVNAAVATGATTGCVRLLVTYICSGAN